VLLPDPPGPSMAMIKFLVGNVDKGFDSVFHSPSLRSERLSTTV
jgi:hypothetical protein